MADNCNGQQAGAAPKRAVWPTWCGVATAAILIVVVVCLITTSFSYLNYYEVGLRQQKSTSTVFLDKVYGPGRYFMGPDMTFEAFETDAHYVEYDSLDIFTSDKLDTQVDIYYVYFLKLDELASLKQDYDTNYDQIIQNEGMAALKNAATQFTTEQYFQNRTLIEDALFKALQTRLSEIHVFVPQMFLGHVTIPDTVAQKQLSTAIQIETNAEQIYQSQAALIRKETDALVNEINNNATIVTQTANSQAGLVDKTAEASALAMVSSARNNGLALLYSALNVTNARQKAQLDYMQALINANSAGNMTVHVGYQTKLLTS